MLKKGLLIVRTVRHLRLQQVIYQLYYRLKPYKDLLWYKPGSKYNAAFNFLQFTTSFELNHIEDNQVFNFLNLKKEFNGEIDWNYQGYGKLWNYNLQYFNYLHQSDLPSKVKIQWLKDISLWLDTGRLKLEQYPVAVRTINTMRFISREGIADREVMADIYGQLAYLANNLEYHLLGNHLLEDAFALFMGGAFFNNKSWSRKSKEIIQNQLIEQVLTDGGHFELSPMYHQIILFRVLELIDWYSKVKDHDICFLNLVKSKAQDMLGWLSHITFKNGNIPHFNDSSDGITFSSSELFKFATLLNITPNYMVELSSSGYRKFESAKYECVVDTGPVGPSYQPGHAHSDILSFVLYGSSHPLIVDTGTSTYQIGDRRTLERSTIAHNTVAIGSENQSEVWGGFRVARRAKPSILADEPRRLVASHDGYQNKFGNTHVREFIFGSADLTIIDSVSGKNQQGLKALFHFHPDCKVTLNSNKVVIENVAVMDFTAVENACLQDYELANGYNKYLSAKRLVLEFRKELRTTITFH